MSKDTYYWRNKAKISERVKARRLEDPEKYRERCRAYYEKNKDRILGYKKKHRDANRERYNKRSKLAREQRPEVQRDYHLRKKFGITLEQYDEMLSVQGGVCAICGNPEDGRNLAVDHCHESGKVRGLLCMFCNVSLGRFAHDLERIERAAAYLRKHYGK